MNTDHIKQVTDKTFPTLFKRGLTKYVWISPQNESSESGGFQFLYGSESTPLTFSVDSSMIGSVTSATKKEFQDGDSEQEGTTTFVIQSIPVGSLFRWNYELTSWVYRVKRGRNVYFFKVPLIEEVFTTNALMELERKENDVILYKYRLIEQTNYEALISAMNLKKLLASLQLNVVTAESLTAGMIVKTLVDIPGNGATVYGGFCVYDTDAKRQFLQVTTRGVYSHKTAFQMASGALDNSRATVSIAVTGNSMPTPDDTAHMGQVFLAIGLRIPNKYTNYKYTIVTFKRDFCTLVQGLCNEWKVLHQRKGNPAPFQMTSMIADFVRMKTVASACTLACSVIGEFSQELQKELHLPNSEWDKFCKPSWIIEKYLDKNESSQNITSCEGYDDNDYGISVDHKKKNKKNKKKLNS